ncbi:MAG: class II aldolase/adducin family protein [Bacteroidales bacterium]|nr:class II aldolase/adducin family protein [Bacteroidales bacterium]MDD3859976.1 class II aldolase/adducin family protein [Bacteroidales bacterium]
MEFKIERKTVAKIMRRLYKQNLTTASGGNVSMKNSDGYVFITASRTDKSCMNWKDIIIIDPSGKNITSDLKPSMETRMHLEIYKTRSDIFAIVHAHPVYASTFAVSGIKPQSSITGESRFILGDIVMADYKLMGSECLAQECSKSLEKSETAILKNHGAICIGNTIFEAYNRMEVLEMTCKIYFNTLLINRCNVLSEEDLKKLDDMK